MNHGLVYLFALIFLMSSCEDQYVYTPPEGIKTPTDIYGDMYKEMLIKDTIGISREVANGFPKSTIRDIKLSFRKQKNDQDFDIHSFINEHWNLERPRETGYIADKDSSIEDISNALWSALEYDSSDQPEFSSLISLPHPYIPVNGQVREMRYMDSYFIMVGLAADGKWDMVQQMLDNCAYLIDEIGHVPETNRTYMTSRSNQPFFSHMVELLAHNKGDQVYTKYLPQLEKERDYWHKDESELEHRNGVGHTLKVGDKLLNRYSDPNNEPRDEDFLNDRRGGNNLYRIKRANSESGWKMSSRWMNDNKRMWSMYTRHVAPIDLNTLLQHLEKTILKGYSIAGKNAGNEIKQSIASFQLALDSLYWNDKKKIFEDVNYKNQARTGQASLAMVYPLFTKVCSQNQADGVAAFITGNLLKKGGLMDTDDYSDHEWDAPNAHAPLQYIAVIGLDNYGHKELAQKVAKRYTETIEKSFAATGHITEMYNLSESEPAKMIGKYNGRDAYSWTLGVYLALKNYLAK